jgi:hypothetical protein
LFCRGEEGCESYSHRSSVVDGPEKVCFCLGKLLRLYGLSKIHKVGVPLRPIISTIGAPHIQASIVSSLSVGTMSG